MRSFNFKTLFNLIISFLIQKHYIMKNLIFTLATTLLFGSLSAQDSKHVNYYKNPAAVENETYQASFDNVVSKMDYSKFAFKIKNLTNDYLIIRKDECAFTLDGKEYTEKDKEIIVSPNKQKVGTFNVSGETNYHVDNFSFKLGGLYILPAEGKVHEAPNFKLPASNNEEKFGDFKIKLKSLKKETKESVAVFEVTYLGDDFAIVDPSKLAVTIPDKGDSEFANDAKADGDILKKGKTCTIRAVFHIPAKYKDMQFANMEILWRDVFQTSLPTKVEDVSVDFEIDPGLTAAKNK